MGPGSASRENAKYKLEMADIEDRRGSYCNLPTEKEIKREAFLAWARIEDRRVFALELQGKQRCAMYATMQ